MPQGVRGIFEQEEQFATEKCTNRCRGDYPPSIELRDRVATCSPQLEVEPEGEDVSEGLKQEMGMDGV